MESTPTVSVTALLHRTVFQSISSRNTKHQSGSVGVVWQVLSCKQSRNCHKSLVAVYTCLQRRPRWHWEVHCGSQVTYVVNVAVGISQHIQKNYIWFEASGRSRGAVISHYIWWIVACSGRAPQPSAWLRLVYIQRSVALLSGCSRLVTSTFKYALLLWLSQTSSGGPHSSQGAVCTAPISPFLINRFLLRQTRWVICGKCKHLQYDQTEKCPAAVQ